KPFLIAQKFEIEQSIMIGWNSPVSYLNILAKKVHDVNYEVIDKRKLWKGLGKARVALIVAVWRNDYKFITILENI
ncbi:3203_t:CDS:1, partial [Gigaspora rosea]